MTVKSLLRAFFSMNIRSAVLKNSVLARRLANLNRPLFETMLTQIRITNLTIDKMFFSGRRTLNKAGVPKLGIRKKTGFTKVVQSKDNAEQKIISIHNDSASIEEIIFSENYDERTFVFKDSPKKLPKQRAKYTVSILMNTPFKQYISNISDQVQNSLTRIKVYQDLANLKSRNIRGPELSERFVTQQVAAYPDESQAPWISSTLDYASLLML